MFNNLKEKVANNKKLRLVIAMGFVFVSILFLTISIRVHTQEKRLPYNQPQSDNNQVKTKVPVKQAVGTMAYVDGEVLALSDYKGEIDGSEILSLESSSYAPLSLNTEIYEGMLIITKDNSYASLVLNDDSEIRLDANSILSLKKYTDEQIQVENVLGNVYSRVSEAERSFEVFVASDIVKSVGTAFMVKNNKNLISVMVYEGRVTLESQNEATDENGGEDALDRSLNEGEYMDMVNTENAGTEKQVQVINAEKLLEEPFVVWNIEQDKKSEKYQDKLGIFKEVKILLLNVLNPKNNLVTTEESVIVSGEIELGAKLTINGESIKNDNGKFTKTVKLKIGSNEFKLEATKGNLIRNQVIIVKRVEQVSDNTTNQNDTNTDPTNNNNNNSQPDPGNTSPTPEPDPVDVTPDGFNLKGTQQSNGIKLDWTLNNMDISGLDGFYVVYSTRSQTPVYPYESYPPPSNDAYIELGNINQRSYVLPVANGTYNIRMCLRIKTTSICNQYSNKISVTAPNMNLNIQLETTGVSGPGYTEVRWSTNYLPENGYILLYSNNPNPAYPYTGTVNSQSTFQVPKPIETTSLWRSVGQISNTYYARVCARNYANTCFYYSNEITTNIANYN